jgi:uncharacterized protein with von Willebrand factor type A (vWA) domain
MREAGKGDKQRPTDKKKFDESYDLIFKKKPKTPEEQEAIVEMTKLQKELYEKDR